jgi:hypothetical protein
MHLSHNLSIYLNIFKEKTDCQKNYLKNRSFAEISLEIYFREEELERNIHRVLLAEPTRKMKKK